ncbi:MAG: CRISPR-associated endonuclease Cas1 [Nitrospirae bacterium]|nr:CRISPR-associated endonuclease Cas1 [Nitrospirota bacterium]
MANLYLTEQGSVLSKTGDRLIVRKEGEVLLDVPCSKVDAVLIFGNVHFTTQAVHELFEHGIEMALLTRTGRLVGQITSPFTKNIELRVKQFERYHDEAFKLGLSKTIVQGKIANCLSLMSAFSYNHPERNLAETVARIETTMKGLNDARDTSALMGIEGITAKTYFSGFAKMILADFVFEGRKKHPSTDPVNALLSFGYTLLFNEISSLLDGLGFDPYLGYFHEVEYGRASLATDIQEEFRASIDRFTLYLVNNRMVGRDDFYPNPKDGAMYLKRDAMKKYFVEYEKYLNREFKHSETAENTTLRKCFRIQAEKLAGHIRGAAAYTPFMPES